MNLCIQEFFKKNLSDNSVQTSPFILYALFYIHKIHIFIFQKIFCLISLSGLRSCARLRASCGLRASLWTPCWLRTLSRLWSRTAA